MRFSVIIPLFNKAPYVAKAIKSVLSQTFGDYELIILDDGSTDESFDIALRVIDGHENCHLHRQQNAGVSMARNNAVALSHGDYLCFLDADDWWASTFLEKMDWLINEYPEAGIYGTNYFYVKNNRQRICVTTAETGYINYCKVYAEKLQMPLTSISSAMPRWVFDEFGGFKPSLKLGEDFDLWIRVALKYKVAFNTEPLAYYFQDSEKKWRAVGRLYAPENHMLWNLDYLEEEEKTNRDYKQLIDKLRSYNLMPYYLSKKYRSAAKEQLAKVQWDDQSAYFKRFYNTPVTILKCKNLVLKVGSCVKQWLKSYI